MAYRCSKTHCFFTTLAASCDINIAFVDSQLNSLHFPAYATAQLTMSISNDFINLHALRSSINYPMSKAETFDKVVAMTDYNLVAKRATTKYVRETPTFKAIHSDMSKPALNPPLGGTAASTHMSTEATLTAEVKATTGIIVHG